MVTIAIIRKWKCTLTRLLGEGAEPDARHDGNEGRPLLIKSAKRFMAVNPNGLVVAGTHQQGKFTPIEQHKFASQLEAMVLLTT